MYDTGLADPDTAGIAVMGTHWNELEINGVPLSDAFAWTLQTPYDAWVADSQAITSRCKTYECDPAYDADQIEQAMYYFSALPSDQQAKVRLAMQEATQTDDYMRGKYDVPLLSWVRFARDQAEKPEGQREVYINPKENSTQIFDTDMGSMMRLILAGQLCMMETYGQGSAFEMKETDTNVIANPLRFFAIPSGADPAVHYIKSSLKNGSMQTDYYFNPEIYNGMQAQIYGQESISLNVQENMLTSYIHEAMHQKYASDNKTKTFALEPIQTYVNEYNSRYYQGFIDPNALTDTSYMFFKVNGIKHYRPYGTSYMCSVAPGTQAIVTAVEEAIKAQHPYTPEQVRDLFIAAGYKQTDPSAGQ